MTTATLLDVGRVNQRPQWIVPLAMAAVLLGALPVIHQLVFGPDLIATAAIEQIEADVQRTVGPAAHDRVKSSIAGRSLPAYGIVVSVVNALLILLSAVVLNVATLAVGGRTTPVQVLAVASVATCAETVLRAVAFGVAVAFVAPERVVSFAWTGVGRSDLAVLGGWGNTALWTTFASSADIFTMAGVAIASVGLKRIDPALTTPRSVLAASAWPAAGLALRLLLAGIVGIPIR